MQFANLSREMALARNLFSHAGKASKGNGILAAAGLELCFRSHFCRLAVGLIYQGSELFNRDRNANNLAASPRAKIIANQHSQVIILQLGPLFNGSNDLVGALVRRKPLRA